MKRKDGSYHWVLARGAVVNRGTDGKPLRAIGTLRDISDSKALRESLLASQRELLEAQRIARAGSWTLNLNTGEVTWTSELYRMLGLDTGLPPPGIGAQRSLFAPKSYQTLREALARLNDEGIPYELELEVLRADRTDGCSFAERQSQILMKRSWGSGESPETLVMLCELAHAFNILRASMKDHEVVQWPGVLCLMRRERPCARNQSAGGTRQG